MIEESRPRMRSRTGARRRLRVSQALVSLATVGGLVLGGMVLAAPGQADPPDEADAPSSIEESAEPTQEPSEPPETNEQEEGDAEDPSAEPSSEPSESAAPESETEAKRPSPKPTEEESEANDNVCPPLDSGKIDTTGDPMSITIPNAQAPLPAGKVIVKYCVKAGSSKQGFGPIEVDVNPPATSVTFSYPLADKAISHYSFAWESAPEGSFQIMKELTNPDGAAVPETFAIDYECKIDDDVTKSGSEDVTPGMTGVAVSGVPVGSTCRIDEMTPNPIEGYTWSPVSYDPQSVEIASADGTFTVKAKNEITKVDGDGSLKIIKELSNPNDATVPESFAIDYDCKIEGDTTKSGSVDVAPGEDGEMVSGIPVGSTCAITEEELTPIEGFTWADVMYDPKSVDIESAGETFTVKVKNKITKKHGGGGGGGLELVKELTGGPDDYTGPFTIEYECTKEDKTPVSGSEEVSAGSPVLVSDIGNGYECVVSEPLLPNPPTGYSFEDPTFDPVDATVKTKGKEAVTVITRNTLTRDEGNLRITKSLAGTPADFDPEFDVSYTCTLEGEEDITGSATISNEGTVEVPTEGSIPTGYECTVTEGALPALPAGLVWNAPGYSNNQGTDPGNVVTIVKNTVNAPDQELPIDQMATVAIANSATTPSVPVTPSSGGGVSTPAPVAPVTPVEPASPVEPAVPVEPASPVEPAVPVEPASPETPAAVEPAGVPLLVPAGGGAASGITDDLPVAAYLLVLLGMGTAVGGAAYLLRSR